MQEPRQLQAEGGIMTLQEPRQGYFLGKLVKKAVRGVKKIVKSPLGKAAIGIGALAALGGAGLAQAGVLGGAGATTASGGLTAKQVALQEAAKYSGGIIVVI